MNSDRFALSDIIKIYEEVLTTSNEKLSKVKKQIYRIGTLRLLFFIIGVVGIFYFASSGWVVIVGILLVTFIPFLGLIKYHNSLFWKKEYLENKIKINQEELAALNYDYSSFEDGKEYIDPTHLYTFDLDVFGKNSLFQYINRTCTSFGKQKLAQWFIEHLKSRSDIELRQEAVKELAPEIKLRQKFRILGMLYKGDKSDGDEVLRWAEMRSHYKGKKLFDVLIWLVPVVNLLLLILGLLDVISFNWLGFSFIFFVLCNLGLQKGISSLQFSYEKKLKILSTYARLIELIENKAAESYLIQRIQQKLVKKNKSAFAEINDLSSKMDALNQRNNILISLILNGLLFWELRQVIKIEAWREKNRDHLADWLDAVGEMDALLSLATFSYNHPDYIYPEIIDTPFQLEATSMGHPLMNREKCVKNDIHILNSPFFLIITGANMAGKSTYLRTLGVNYLLACVGAPVNCESMKLYPSQLITSLRTSDSLTDNESYFFAELKRLKLIIDKLNAGEKLFIILDEILKGTNSMDKQKGSMALIKQFLELNATGIIATHDLLLGSLQEIFPDNIRNYRFEADITGDELTFSYQLQSGVAQNMNACFLMNKMGIIVDE